MMVTGTGDPRSIDVLVVTARELVTALETRLTTDREVVLRVTPPFSGRMRARLHRVTGQPRSDPPPVHVSPEVLVPSAPPYPDATTTEDRLRADPEAEYSIDRHHRCHRQAVREWRAAVPEAADERISLSADGRSIEADLRILDADWSPLETD